MRVQQTSERKMVRPTNERKRAFILFLLSSERINGITTVCGVGGTQVLRNIYSSHDVPIEHLSRRTQKEQGFGASFLYSLRKLDQFGGNSINGVCREWDFSFAQSNGAHGQR